MEQIMTSDETKTKQHRVMFWNVDGIEKEYVMIRNKDVNEVKL